MRKTWVWSLGWEEPLEKGMATHSSILDWRIQWTLQGWARHWAALIRALWRGGGVVRGGGRPGSRPPSPVPTRHNTCTGLCTHGVHVLGGEPHRWSLTMRLETKSLASSDTASKVSSSKYQLLDRTLFRVSVSSSPRKGERPLRLEGGDGRRQGGKIGCCQSL